MDGLDVIFRRMIGSDTHDALLERGVHLAYLISDGTFNRTYARMGGFTADDEGPASVTVVGHGETPQEAALALFEEPAARKHAPNLKTSLWAFGEACELLAGAYRGS